MKAILYKPLFSKLLDLISLIAIVVLLYAIGRVYLYHQCSNEFSTFSTGELTVTLLSGLLYDLYIVLIINSLFIVLFLYPIKIYNSAFYQLFLKIIFVLFNTIPLIIHFLDINFFKLNLKRMDYYDFWPELMRIFNQFKNIDFHTLIHNYLVVIVLLVLVLVILSSALWYIRPHYYEPRNSLKLYKSVSITAFALFVVFFVNYAVSDPLFLSKIHLQSSRKLIPLLVNNPYLIIQSARYNPVDYETWDFEEFNPERKYEIVDSTSAKHVQIVMVNFENDSSWFVSPNYKVQDIYKISSLEISKNSLFQYLDAVLIGIPAFLPADLCQSIHSLNKFCTLPEMLKKSGFYSRLITYGYDKNTVLLIKNFYGFDEFIALKNAQIEDNKGAGKIISPASSIKYFDFYLLNFISQSIQSHGIIDSIINNSKLPNNLCFLSILPSKLNYNKPEIKKSLFLICQSQKKNSLNFDSVISQPLDIYPSILHYIGYKAPFIAYGSSLFSKEGKKINVVSSSSECYVLEDSLLLRYSNNSTTSLLHLTNSGFFDFDYKDSLVVEKIKLENYVHSIRADYFQRLRENRLEY